MLGDQLEAATSAAAPPRLSARHVPHGLGALAEANFRRPARKPSIKLLSKGNSAECSEREQWRETRKLRRSGRRDRRFQVKTLATAIPATKVAATDIAGTTLKNCEYAVPIVSNATRMMRSTCQSSLNLLVWPPRPLPDTRAFRQAVRAHQA